MYAAEKNWVIILKMLKEKLSGIGVAGGEIMTRIISWLCDLNILVNEKERLLQSSGQHNQGKSVNENVEWIQDYEEFT